ncbi:metal-sensing transcriptional repressor [Gottfriedia luciferensis]|uniref:metal-sensing transcriptional repressor n=1 Tax=Gottfriedia luciferensis TaxID=178774 RepID=UPI000B442F37|nr:metal-sensing transcriptional repressor [Gottfriedia luciferensis]
MENCHDDQMVPRSEEEITDLMKRLRRIEGQVRGIQKMVEEDRYCIDILTQIMAVEAAMKKVSFSLIERHANHCMVKAVKENNGEASVSELMDVIKRYVK